MQFGPTAAQDRRVSADRRSPTVGAGEQRKAVRSGLLQDTTEAPDADMIGDLPAPAFFFTRPSRRMRDHFKPPAADPNENSTSSPQILMTLIMASTELVTNSPPHKITEPPYRYRIEILCRGGCFEGKHPRALTPLRTSYSRLAQEMQIRSLTIRTEGRLQRAQRLSC